jgi:hypothetical protein
LEISFETRRLRDLCEDEVLAEEVLSKTNAELLRIKLSDIRAAENVEELQIFKPVKGVYDGHSCLVFELAPPNAIVLVPQGKGVDPGAMNSSWLTVRRVKVVSLESTDVK